jgi:TPR repeat protein
VKSSEAWALEPEAWAQEPDLDRLRAADAFMLTDHERALQEYQYLAKIGSPMSMLALGLMYERGQGIAPDLSKSFEYYGLASEKGLARATFNLGRLYHNQGNYKKAEEAFLIGVFRKDPRAMHWLAMLYCSKSLYGSEKINEAVSLLRRAMAIGHIESSRKLGSILIYGHCRYRKVPKGLFYFYYNGVKALMLSLRDPSNERLLDSPKLGAL